MIYRDSEVLADTILEDVAGEQEFDLGISRSASLRASRSDGCCDLSDSRDSV